MKNKYLKLFVDGFIGSLVLASIIIMAIPRVVSEFVNHKYQVEQQNNKQ